METEEAWISTGECARRHSVSRQAISAAILRGDLVGRKVGRTYIVKAADCNAWVPNRAQAAKTKKRWADQKALGSGESLTDRPAKEANDAK